MTLSDQQVVTGISIIIGGLSQLQWGISSYHWQTVINLAWFSTMTHLITLTALWEEVCSTTPVKLFRIVGMGILVIMLLCVLGPIGYLTTISQVAPGLFIGEPLVALPAWCLYHPSVQWKWPDAETDVGKDYDWVYATFTLGLLVWAYLTRAALLIQGKTGFSHNILRIPQDQPWRLLQTRLARLQNLAGPSRWARFRTSLEYKLLRSIYAVLVAGIDLYRSKVWEVCCMVECLRGFTTSNC